MSLVNGYYKLFTEYSNNASEIELNKVSISFFGTTIVLYKYMKSMLGNFNIYRRLFGLAGSVYVLFIGHHVSIQVLI